MKTHLTPHRRAAAWLFAAAALPLAPLAAQDPPVVNAPPPVITAPPPVTVAPAPPPAVRIAPPPVAAPAPAPVATRAAPPPARTATRTVRTATRTIVRPRAEAAPVRRPAAAPAAPAPAPAPVAAAPEPVPVATPAAAAPVAAPERTLTTLWPWLAGAALLLIAAIAVVALRRRRTEEEVYYDEPVYEPAEPVVEAAPEPSFTHEAPIVAAAALHQREAEPVADEVAIVESDAADVEALAAGSEPIAGRPWLEFLMRPLRAGTSRDDAIVQFELTVGNTGSVEAKDVRISTWMVAGGQGTDMERSLIDPPADATVNEVDIAAGDGARVEARIALPKAGMTEPVLPVVVADARYTLPDGSEGRTHASFEIGRPEGEGEALAPFPIDRSSGLSENVEARLHGEPERV